MPDFDPAATLNVKNFLRSGSPDLQMLATLAKGAASAQTGVA